MDPAKPMSWRAAQRFFAAALFFSATATFLAVGGIGSAQALCHDDSMSNYWTPAYAMFIQQTAVLKPWTCAWWQTGFWWVIGCQLSFVLFITIAWASGFLFRHAMPFFAHGATASALSVVACLALMDASSYYVGYARTVGCIAFSGFCAMGLANGILGLALAELIFSKANAMPVANALPVAGPADVEPLNADSMEKGLEGDASSGGPSDKSDSGI